MYILGISCFYHDASAALVKDGVVVAAAQEERFSRKKHDTSFPKLAIEWCLREAGITIDDITYIGFYEKPFLKFERLLSQHITYWPRSFKTFVNALPAWLHEKLRAPRIIRKQLGYRGDVLFIPHHMAHAASAFLVSPFSEAAIVTVDGVGEWTTTAYGTGEGIDLTLLQEIRFPHSLGLLYSTITAYLGFSVNNSEYKVMGLAPYGTMDREKNPWYEKLCRVIDVKSDGSYRLDMRYFTYQYADRMPSALLCELLGGPVRVPESALEDRHRDIAAAVQLVLEDVMTQMLTHVQRVTGKKQVVLAGGVALNSVYNGKIIQRTPFTNVWVQPDAGDGGTSLGVAVYIYHTILRQPRKAPLTHAYLGPQFSKEQVRTFLDRHNIVYTEYPSDDAMVTDVANRIYCNQVVGWMQGKMEWGPRALGARSILSNPCNKGMQAILNEKVKHREAFRPFAPVVCVDDADTYFVCDMPLPEATDYMLMVYPVREQWREVIPAVTHVDGSGRLQTVRRQQHPLYYDLIKEFGKHSGVPILINTSFNIRGEPIVCTPEDAYRCMMGTGIDCVVIDHFLIQRKDNLKDAWDSDVYATD